MTRHTSPDAMRPRYRIPLLAIVLLLQCGLLRGQFLWPVDSPRVITGNYGELRPNHFHAGIDFSTGQKTGKEIYAADEAYVSRIRVSSVGYGKVVYLTHPNGKVTVYAHLQSFSVKIDGLVKAEQLRLKSYEIELLPAPRTVFVRRGEIIGLSGNSGGSSGPHLHFEIRDEKSETPLNPLRFYKVPDQVKPTLQSIAFFDLADTCAPKLLKTVQVKSANDSAWLEGRSVSLETSVIGIAFAGYDQLEKDGNRNNVYGAKLFLDGRMIYGHSLETIDFADNRYVNEFSMEEGRLRFQKCFLPTLYPSRFYSAAVEKGRIVLGDTAWHTVSLQVSDETGNLQQVIFRLRAWQLQPYKSLQPTMPLFADCRRVFAATGGSARLIIPSQTLYQSSVISIRERIRDAGSIDIQPELNLRTAASLSFPVPAKFGQVAEKLVLKGGNAVYIPARRGDSLFFQVKNFGKLYLLADIIAPEIRPMLSFNRLKKAKNLESLSFMISDELSGIAEYSLYINDARCLTEYDAKNDMLTYSPDETLPEGDLDIRVEVEDRSGNVASYRIHLKSLQFRQSQ
jgi:hypothetical protein